MVGGLTSDPLENAALPVEVECKSAHEPVPILLRQEEEPNVQGQLKKRGLVMLSLALLTEVGVSSESGASVPNHAEVVFSPAVEPAQTLPRHMAARIVWA